jgi:predicted metal-binding protein
MTVKRGLLLLNKNGFWVNHKEFAPKNPEGLEKKMKELIKIGIIICHRYHNCAGGKCLRAMWNREGAFKTYKGQEIELVGYTTCDGSPGGNVEYAPAEMMKNGAEVIHFATGLVVGYPPCPYLFHFRDFIQSKYGIEVVLGTHPIPQGYYETHQHLGTWASPEWQRVIAATLTDEETRLAYS